MRAPDATGSAWLGREIIASSSLGTFGDSNLTAEAFVKLNNKPVIITHDIKAGQLRSLMQD